MAEKQCIKCGVVKSLDDFYPHPQMADGRLNKCKECAKRDVAKNYGERRVEKSEYEAGRNSLPSRRVAKAEYQRRHRQRFPEKVRARSAVGHAVRDGRLTKLPCERCGSPKSQAHHEDYSRPLDVRWLCFRCHRESAHGQVVVSAE